MRHHQSLRAHAALTMETPMPSAPQFAPLAPRATRNAAVHSAAGRTALALLAIVVSLSPGYTRAQNKPALPHTAASPAKHATVRDASFRSESLGKEMRYRVILPVGYEDSAERYPTLFLLHGLHGDFQNWSTRTSLIRYAEHFRLIIAMPDAGDSWYVNSATNPADKFEDYIVKDFITEVDAHFRSIREPYARAIAGLSMGGYGAIRLALKYPQLFAVAGGISAALNAPTDLDEKAPDFRANLQSVFGPHDSPTRQQNDATALLAHADPAKLPYIYLDCGTGDAMFLQSNRELAANLQERKAGYEFHEMPGAHQWGFWDVAILRFLETLARRSLTSKN
jgi:putative tributyrin esterase